MGFALKGDKMELRGGPIFGSVQTTFLFQLIFFGGLAFGAAWQSLFWNSLQLSAFLLTGTAVQE